MSETVLQKCPIWQTSAKVSPGPDSLIVDSSRAGGLYRITGSAVPSLSSLSPDMKAKLTWWLVEQRRQGEKSPEITSYTLKRVRVEPSPTILERRDRILDYVANSSTDIMPRIVVSGVVTEKMTKQKAELAAHTGSQSEHEVNELIRFLREDRLIDGNESLQLTFHAWQYIEKRRLRQTASKQAFVAMWFDPDMESIYENGFEPAIRQSGYECMRIDRKEHVNKIDDEIIAEIRRSRFLVADFTSEPERPRGGVYFEAGLAYGLNLPVIWACREDLIGQLHFDIRQFNHIVWQSSEELRLKLRNRIGAVIGDGPLVT